MKKLYVCHPKVLNSYPFEIAKVISKKEIQWQHSLEMLNLLMKQGFVSCDKNGVPTKRDEFPRWVRWCKEDCPPIQSYLRVPASLLIESIGESRAKLLTLVDLKELYLPSPMVFDAYSEYFVIRKKDLASLTYWLKTIELTLPTPLNPQVFSFQPYPLSLTI